MSTRSATPGRIAPFGIGSALLILVLMILALTACGGEGNRLPIPPKGFIGDAAQGERLYRSHCSGCHGKDAEGSHRGPPLLHKYYAPSHHADLAFYMAVARGVQQHHWQFGNMPPVSGVSPEEVGHIIAYVRGEQRKVGIQ